ncbi:NADH dehydrogenase subunit 2 (mitochondrion) [Danio rerio]|uniref:NADH-ubiquinone oxidoreductase chain 2 n=2 Tax=Danio rerio TaxID=7955 RepID=NU2M_DANRE|nr:NADH dehydrogenase subunit 2 [Danio rerio]Q9MIY9.1 RecName: Full=NADH-ubiquinone oxidoreductase chain 2; AltName: Full=NADH dehydrogenase subunit 2 [Danio rerio]AAF74298.1 NADH dehydrogenase subunit II [Danio rerio]AIW65024.1 NADH dehydrogenase subunit 2 [Danio rerio]ALK26775.1 NADH dehydrogenase subunit 2 [Danio rerio]ALK26827.1 NADH dehydrogenase subunit 2 [Danio rerio]|eukprot:NP_059332.1 NADH dehydrogenase subunit 2 (mitochondrion) [Danio rerio]
MNPYVLMILMSSLGLGTTLTFSSSHWILAWMGLEINTLAIVPLMAQQHHPRAVEATTKYFLIQAAAAAMILFTSTTNAWISGQWDVTGMPGPATSTAMMFALALKIGLAPMHFWLPEVLQGLDLLTGLILSTWQKLAPMALIIQTTQTTDPLILTSLGIASSLIGGWSGLNQTQLRKILAYSSIAHMGWMIIVIQYAPQLTLIALGTYIFMTSAAFLTLKVLSATKINTLTTTWPKSPILAAIATLVMLSLGGLPPLTGFMPKWLILQELTKQDLPATATIMALTALLSLFFYLRLCHAMTLTTSPNTINSAPHWRVQTTQNSLPLTISVTVTMGLLPLTPAILMLTT